VYVALAVRTLLVELVVLAVELVVLVVLAVVFVVVLVAGAALTGATAGKYLDGTPQYPP